MGSGNSQNRSFIGTFMVRHPAAHERWHVERHYSRLGYDTLWVTDHIVVPFEIKSRYPYSATGQFIIDATGDYLEPLSALSFLAGRTRRIRVGTPSPARPRSRKLKNSTLNRGD